MASMKTHQTHSSAINILQSQSLSTVAQQEIERLILTGEIGPGEKLNEADVADRLNISRGPIREAFRALEELGLVRFEKNRGVFVREISLPEADDIFAVRAALEQLVGRTLAENIADEDLDELAALTDRMGKAAQRNQIDVYATLNFEFHDLLVTLTKNGKLISIYRRLVKELTLFRQQSLAQTHALDVSIAEHRAIVDAIATRDPGKAGQALFDHVMASRERMHKAHGAPVASPPPPQSNTRRKRK